MIKNITFAVLLPCLIALTSYAHQPGQLDTTLISQLLEKHGAGFGNLEHQKIGNDVKLHFINKDIPSEHPLLHLPNGLKLSYGDLVTFGGDIFGDEDYPIARCKPEDKKSCFLRQFNTLAVNGQKGNKQCSNPLVQVKSIQKYLSELNKAIEEAEKKGQTASEFYLKHSQDISKALNRLTCGGSFISDYLPFGQYIKLAQVNFDHFHPDAPAAYKIGHEIALETAMKAYQERLTNHEDKAQQWLELAYAQNAFANHFLTDAFSSGHMRTPRQAIDKDIHLPAVLKLLIANLMHDEDNRLGLNVINAQGLSWKAYGDGYLFTEEAQMQRLILTQAMQQSADSVYEVAMTGKLPKFYPELNLFPDTKALEQLNETAPLFKVENGVLLKRTKNHDPYHFEWTSRWSGLITLLQFKLG
ncbi:phospholipase [Legionella israelensis]|uniref:phospholipase n=1 Tax=Legionella israelensis TaxID=454 RepID=UPI0011811766|nr:phospholipase [Legionella israelensis]QDP72684.1 phospholipase [Legionella israelensis]